MPMQVADLGLLLLRPPPDVPETGTVELLAGGSVAWAYLRVAPGGSWTAPDADLEERTLLVLDGRATVTIDDTRQTLGPGHLTLVQAGAALAVRNETTAPFHAMLATSPPPGKESPR